ncbi:MAG: isochorismatase family protein [Burkholderiaceae bacterium]|nr:isochorismatase family protein [Burkholderiaceae bacterium]
MNPWDDVISAEEQRAYGAAGFGRPSGLGIRPALLIIDVQYRTVGTVRAPFWDAIKEFPTSCGEVGWQAVDAMMPLVQLFRERGWPVLYPHVAPKVATEGGRLAEKVPAIMGISAKGYEFVTEVAPKPGDVLIPKKHPSAFFGTALCSHLIDLAVDTVIVTGCTTSGCVRGTVVDAFSLNFKVAVPYDCVYDRGITSHKVNLFDIAQKYADVMPATELITRLKATQPTA